MIGKPIERTQRPWPHSIVMAGAEWAVRAFLASCVAMVVWCAAELMGASRQDAMAIVGLLAFIVAAIVAMRAFCRQVDRMGEADQEAGRAWTKRHMEQQEEWRNENG